MNKENLESVKVKFLKAYSPYKKGDEGFVLKGLVKRYPQHFKVLENSEKKVKNKEEKKVETKKTK